MTGCSSANAAAIVTGRPVITRPSSTMSAGADQLVQRGQRRDRGDRDQVAAAEPADLAFHTAFLVRAVLARDAEEQSYP